MAPGQQADKNAVPQPDGLTSLTLVHPGRVTSPATPTSQLSLVVSEASYQYIDGNREMRIAVPFLDYLVNGTSLRAMLREAGYGEGLVTGLCRPWPGSTEKTVKELLGGAAGRALAVDMLVCKVCGDRDCGALLADVIVDDERVTWTNWRFTASNGSNPTAELPQLTFERGPYETVLRAAPAAVAELPYGEKVNRARRVLWPWQWGWRLPSGG